MFRYKLFPNSPIYFNSLPPAQYFGPQVSFVRNPDGTYEPAPKPDYNQAELREKTRVIEEEAKQAERMRQAQRAYESGQIQQAYQIQHAPAPAIVAAQPPQAENIPQRSNRIQPFINQVIELRNKRNREGVMPGRPLNKFPHAHPLDFMSAFNSALQSGAITDEDAPLVIEDLYNQGLVNFELPQTEHLMTKYRRRPSPMSEVQRRAAEMERRGAERREAEAQRPIAQAQMQQLASPEMRQAAPILNIFQQQGNMDRNIIPPYIRALREAAQNPPVVTQYVNRGPNRRERAHRIMQHLEPGAYAGEIPEEDEE